MGQNLATQTSPGNASGLATSMAGSSAGPALGARRLNVGAQDASVPRQSPSALQGLREAVEVPVSVPQSATTPQRASSNTQAQQPLIQPAVTAQGLIQAARQQAASLQAMSQQPANQSTALQQPGPQQLPSKQGVPSQSSFQQTIPQQSSPQQATSQQALPSQAPPSQTSPTQAPQQQAPPSQSSTLQKGHQQSGQQPPGQPLAGRTIVKPANSTTSPLGVSASKSVTQTEGSSLQKPLMPAAKAPFDRAAATQTPFSRSATSPHSHKARALSPTDPTSPSRATQQASATPLHQRPGQQDQTPARAAPQANATPLLQRPGQQALPWSQIRAARPSQADTRPQGASAQAPSTGSGSASFKNPVTGTLRASPPMAGGQMQPSPTASPAPVSRTAAAWSTVPRRVS